MKKGVLSGRNDADIESYLAAINKLGDENVCRSRI